MAGKRPFNAKFFALAAITLLLFGARSAPCGTPTRTPHPPRNANSASLAIFRLRFPRL